MTIRRVVVAVVMLAGCRGAVAPPADLVRLVAAETGSLVRMTLVPAAGARINARLKPVLELADGTRVQFDSQLLTADSAYYAGQPEASMASRGRIEGTLRVGVCPAGLDACLALALPIDIPAP